MSGGQNWQLFLRGVGEKMRIYKVIPNCKVDILFEKIQEDTNISTSELKIVFAGQLLEFKCDKNLSDYNIQNLSTLFLVLQLKGGCLPDERQNRQLSPLPPFVTLTSEPDMITWDDDPSSKRAKMPCGHAIGSYTMREYCRLELEKGNCCFYCPSIDPQTNGECKIEWYFFLVRHVAMMDEEPLKEFEARISENYLRKQPGIQTCPGCYTYCERPDMLSLRVICQICSMNDGPAFAFCWNCLHPWEPSSRACQNQECDGMKTKLKYLSTCEKKDVAGVKNCPSVRACPTCGTLINHTDGCKQMTCKTCRQQFCFICLGLKQDGKLRCGGSYTPCIVAPIQTSLPGSV